jgi:hypothetical protein
MIRYPDQARHVIIEKFPHPQGLLYFEPFWHLAEDNSLTHIVKGAFSGEGPWKMGDAVITVAGCHGTDPEMASAVAEWSQYLQMCNGEYLDRDAILEAARSLGADI